jgi:hypothetical protein
VARAVHRSQRMNKRALIGRVIAGSVEGAIATLPHTAVMFAARHAGMLGKLPPEKITDAMLDAADADTTETTSNVVASVAHVGFGAGCGALYELIAPDTTIVRGAALGVAFATAVWVASYQGWVPAAGIMPPISRDARGRVAAMLGAHVAFGAALGALVAWRGSRRGRRGRRSRAGRSSLRSSSS